MNSRRLAVLTNVFSSQEKEYFIDHLGLLVSSGMTILDAFDALGKDLRSHWMKEVLQNTKEAIESGSPLWQALECSGLFSDHAIALVRIGEQSGNLSKNLRIISEQRTKERAFQSKLRSAMVYPLFVLCLTLFVGISIAWFVLPKLALVFSELHIRLPMITKLLIAFGLFLSSYGVIAVPLMLLSIAAFVYFFFYFPRTRRYGQAILYVMPGLKQFIQQIEMARFGYVLGSLLESNMPITAALHSVAASAPFLPFQRLYFFLACNIEDGYSFKQSFAAFSRANRLMPTPIQQLIITGEQSGHLSDVLQSISRIYESKIDSTAKDITVILEPILLVIVWIGVLLVAIGVILPLYSLIGQFQP